MTTGPGFSSDRFDYREWALGGFRYDEPEDERETAGAVPQEPPLMSPRDGFGGTGLFGGPGADLFGGGRVDESPIPAVPAQQVVNEPDPFTESGSLVRPYTRTGGRTRPDYDLAIEALISTSERGRERDAAVLPEHRSICGLCLETRSVAEVAAHLRLPLGVVRVLIGDMAGLGLVMIHQSGLVMGDRPSLAFLERVLSGLRRL
ncbi:DUF742 domain-containing protein [Allokutzneria sp. A3M-2-11 16]|uniref:DUF742 domain-containing protein n=1 Tax=Allokutzneria sp. A3M-2-11 16 TaxID=2962043 RepID=UPI0020B6FFA3|nr:DUF742 domain-containing protein [Allokutzneria sp. A3M-2-11 16]MCP3800083.1 DUF742 domain-containing protein [Allokutzneria sp. A3M-2-11 16]